MRSRVTHHEYYLPGVSPRFGGYSVRDPAEAGAGGRANPGYDVQMSYRVGAEAT